MLTSVVVAALMAVAAGCSGGANAGQQATANSEPAPGRSGKSLLVSAASDMAPVLEELVPLFERETGARLEINLGSTGQLAQQIEAGAPVDVFLAANAQAVDELDSSRLLPDTRRVYALGRLVLYPDPGTDGAPISLSDLLGPQVSRVAIANPEHAPYGQAAREALQAAEIWDELQGKLVMAENVRQAFQFAQSGNVDVALVALSLAAAAGGEYALVPQDLHQPLEQTLTVIAGTSQERLARRFTTFMTSPQAVSVLEKYGFELP